jgi:hypothetical protein
VALVWETDDRTCEESTGRSVRRLLEIMESRQEMMWGESGVGARCGGAGLRSQLLRRQREEDHGLKPAQQKGLGCGSYGRAPAKQVQGSGLNPSIQVGGGEVGWEPHG